MHTDANDRDAVAAAWVAREDRGPLAPEETARRDAWLRADPRHLGAYARARAVYAQTARARALAGLAFPPAGAASPRRRRWLGGLAAALCLLAPGLVLLPSSSQTYATGRGEILRVPLADGSAVTLDSLSRVRVAYRKEERTIELLEGEALFDVAPDRSRPFVVHADQARVRAVGTSFAVSLAGRRSDGVEVLVREGVVDVADAQGQVAPTRLRANSRALASSSRGIRIEPVQAEEVLQELAWREGLLAFNGDTLSSAVAQFRRYSDLPILIDDPQVGSRRIVGLYSASDPQGFANSVALSLGLVAERRDGAIHLRSQAAPRPGSARSLQ